MREVVPSASGRIAAHWLPLALIAGAGGWIAAGLLEQPTLSAAVLVTVDSDDDHLVNAQEKVLGTSLWDADTDLDGWSDLEEFARQSSPLFPESQPEDVDLQVAMSAHGHGGGLHAVVALFSADPNLRDKKLSLGMQVQGRMVPIAIDQWLLTATMTVVPGEAPGSRIMLLDLPIDPLWIDVHREVSFFVTAGITGTGKVAAAATIHLKSIEGVIVLVTPDPTVLPPPGGPGGGATQAGAGGAGTGTIYIPLPLDDDGTIPVTWNTGEICYQTTSTVGTVGASVLQQVTSAACQSGFAGACPSSCGASVGTTFTTIDPVVLIGG